MSKSHRKALPSTRLPLISLNEFTAEKESFQLSWPVLAHLREYAAYVSEVTGRATSADEVVDKSLQRLFDADKGFRVWLQQKNAGAAPRQKSNPPDRGERSAPAPKTESAAPPLTKPNNA
jgi:hypothetical protein